MKKQDLIAILLLSFYSSSNVFAIEINDNMDIIGNEGDSGDGERYKENVNITGGIINISNDAELSADDYTIDINGDNTTINIKTQGGMFSNELILNSGTVNTSDGFFIGQSDFVMNGGILNVENSQIGGQGVEQNTSGEITTVSGGNTTINSGVININKGKAGWGDSDSFIEYSGNLLVSENITLGGTLNIAEGAGLETRTGFTKMNSDVALDGDISNIKTTSSGVINLGGTLVSNISGQGTLAIINSNAIVDGNISNVNLNIQSNVDLENTFKGSLNANKTTIYSGSSLDIGTNTFKGNSLDIQDNGILAFQVSGKNEGEYGKIVADTINISSNGTKLNLTLDNGALDNGETKTFTILDSSNITGSFAELSKNSRYEFIDNKDGTFDITSVASASNVAIDAGAVEHAGVANAWLDSDKNSITGQAKEIADHLNILSQNNPEKFVEALKALAPSITPITHSEMQSQNQQLFNLVSSRMTSSNIGLSGGDTFKNVGLWVQGLYNKTKYDVEDGFDGKSSGIALGGDAYINDNTKIGLGFAYTNSNIDAIARDIDTDNYSLFLYGEQIFNNVYFNSVLNYNFAKYNENKNVSGIIVKGDYNANSIGVQALTGYNFNNGISPEIGLRYAWTHQGSYTDTASQYVDSNNSNTLTALLGSKYVYNFHRNGLNIVPEISAMLTYDLANSNDNSIVSLANGVIYEIESKELEKFGGELGLKLGFVVNDFEISLKYEGQFKKDFTNDTQLYII